MLELDLFRENSADDGTRSTLMIGDVEICNVLELPWRENARGVSCIPPGRYLVTYLPRSASGRYKDVYHVQDVPGRTGILIHKGNWAGDESLGFKADSDGCQLPCMAFKRVGGQIMGVNSGDALQALHDVTGRQGFYLQVYGV